MNSIPQPALVITDIGQIAIPVNDIDRATAFYRDILGLRMLFAAGPLSFFGRQRASHANAA
ncbi:MAG: VOC family protein [Acidobacteriaceae bacterium]